LQVIRIEELDRVASVSLDVIDDGGVWVGVTGSEIDVAPLALVTVSP